MASPAPDDPLAAVSEIADALGDDVEACLLGGAVPALYPFSPAVDPIRPTEDVDLVVEADDRRQYDRVVKRLLKRGFRHDTEPGAPICRFRCRGIKVDVMPTGDAALGFSNRWYPEAWRTATRTALPSGRTIRLIAPVYFVATKLVAFLDPERTGGRDFVASHDLEDVVTVLRGVADVLEDVRVGPDPVHEFIRATLRSFLADARFLDALPGHFEPDAATQATVRPFVEALGRAAAEPA